jgi:hypothetical protein
LWRTASWSASVVRGMPGRAVASSIPSKTACVMSSSHSRSLGPAGACGPASRAGGSGCGRSGAVELLAPVAPLEHAATSSHAIRRTMQR